MRRVPGLRSPFEVVVGVPGDKSLSHRALVLAAMADGRSRLAGLAPGADVAATISCLRALGVSVEDGMVDGSVVAAWRTDSGPLDAGNSGTTMRLLTGVLAGRSAPTTIVGDESLLRRPMRRLVDPLGRLGATVTVSDDGTAPIVVAGGDLRGADVLIDVASAQVRTAVALAALQAEGTSTIDSPSGYRDHTERWLAALGLGGRGEGEVFEVRPGPIPPLDIDLPGDTSSASALWAAAAIATGSQVTTPRVSLNPGRIGFLEVLRLMGALVDVSQTGDVLGDPFGDVSVTGAPLTGVDVRGALSTRLLDEVPLLAVVAAHASGVTEVSDATELRGKESDRIASVAAMIRALGGTVEDRPDGLVIEGKPLTGGAVDSQGDHRIAIAAAIASAGGHPVDVAGCEAADVSWPGFLDVIGGLWS